MRRTLLSLAACFVSLTVFAGGWERTKNIADDIIYKGRSATFYCGCRYRSDGDGGGDITSTMSCGYVGPPSYESRAARVEWVHIVPASLMPARRFPCWSGAGGSRGRCEKSDPRAQAMIFDLHNLAPSIGQVNALRLNDRYTDLSDSTSDFGGCQIEDASGAFEPPDCKKGDVARVWLYMHVRHGVEIPANELAMFTTWSVVDPVSPWESKREERIAMYSRVINPFVNGVQPDQAGACPWE